MEIDGTGSVVNAGTITGTSNDGVYIDPPTGGGVTNLAGGIIAGNTNGVDIAGGPGMSSMPARSSAPTTPVFIWAAVAA